MRILMLAQFYAPDVGGEERHVQDLSIGLVRRGHEVAVASIWHPGRAEFEIDQGVHVYRLRSTIGRMGKVYSSTERLHAPSFPDPELTLKLWDLVEREQPDIIHAHNWMLHSFLPYSLLKDIPVVLTLHDYSFACPTKRLMYRGKRCSGPAFKKCLECSANHYGTLKGTTVALTNGLMKSFEKRAVDLFLTVSQATAIGNGLPGSGLPYQVIPNFVPDDIGRPFADLIPLIQRLPEPGYLLFVGDLSQEKGVDILLQAYAGLRDAPPLVLIGRKVSGIPNRLPENVYLLGSWPHEAVMEAWRRSSIALIPSVWEEPFGIVAIEAMSVGRPVVASRIGGLSDIVMDGETGLLIPPGDPAALQEAIQSLLDHPIERERMGTAGRVRANDYKASQVIQKIEQVYAGLILEKTVIEPMNVMDDVEVVEK